MNTKIVYGNTTLVYNELGERILIYEVYETREALNRSRLPYTLTLFDYLLHHAPRHLFRAQLVQPPIMY